MKTIIRSKPDQWRTNDRKRTSKSYLILISVTSVTSVTASGELQRKRPQEIIEVVIEFMKNISTKRCYLLFPMLEIEKYGLQGKEWEI